MRIGYFDCFSGASGDMILGALLDAGCPEDRLRDGLARLKLTDARLDVDKVRKQGFAATRASVHTTAAPGHRHLKQILEIIQAAALPVAAARRAADVFTRLAEVEAAVHGTTPHQVHFHEVGAADAIVDIVGAALAIELLEVDRIECSPIPAGSGTVACQHGVMPVPAPATAALLRGVPLAACDEPGELTTPTGAAVLTTLAQGYGPVPAMTLERIGYGAGAREGASRPNLLRFLLGTAAGGAADPDVDHVVVLEANIDDGTGEEIGFAVGALLAAGALDVFTIPVQMKKSRPGILLTVLASPQQADELENLLFLHTPTFGVRQTVCLRHKLRRSVETVATRYGAIAMKIGRRGGAAVIASPEFEDCARAAREHGVAIRDVMLEARRVWNEMIGARS